MTAIAPGVDRFALLPPERPADDLEQEMLRRWTEEDLFGTIERTRDGRSEFVFYEGPPTANGRPGIHHVFSRTVKDLFCRYRVMKGFHVTRKAGWDTHGLPVEIEVEKQLGINGKQQIEEIGVERFNQLCRESVWKYKADWERLSDRIGYQLDYSDPYITYTNDYVESVWWALRTLYDRGLLYRGHKILPYCPRCGTALSSHEVAQGYQEVKDPSVYVAIRLRDSGLGTRSSAAADRRILVWTTTPWTLVSNVALAVHPQLEYLELRRRGETGPAQPSPESTRPASPGTRPSPTLLILAEARVASVFGDDWTDRWEIARRMRGSDLAGMTYDRPLDWAELGEGKSEVIVAETFVSAEDGTGVVHMAPAFGADDYAAGQRHGLSFVQPVNARGEFPSDMAVVGGKFVKAADPLIIEELRRRGVLHKAGTLEHSYPHCWRCGTPLLYYARGSWFVRTTAVRDQMLARNARVEWHPEEVGTGRFGEWLLNNVDWALSRDRYWGSPLPVWVCERDDSHIEVIGGYAELAERLGGALPDDFDPHKPGVDRLAWECAACRDSATGTRDSAEAIATPPGRRVPNPESRIPMMRRVPEVIDTWFDSGSMPFAQWHYPFEGRDQVKRLYPADFIAEGVDQTRGWFYSLLAIATGLGDALPNNSGESGLAGTNAFAAPYRAVVVNDLVLDADGQKMSKSTGNVVDPWSVIPRYGADAVRLFLVTSSQIWVPRRFDERGIRDTAGQFLVTLKNIYSGMFAQYANFGWVPSAEDPRPADRPAIDRWVLGRLARVAQEADAAMASYDAYQAARTVMRFVTDDLSNWYVRLNRERFYDVAGEGNRAVFATLHEVLVAVARLLAPFSPFVTDWMHRQLTGTSVHLAPFVTEPAIAFDHRLDAGMEQVRTLTRLGRAAREEADLKVRQPLSRVVCVVPEGQPDVLADLEPLLRSELNVKRVELVSSGDSLVRLEAKPNFRALGKRFGKSTKSAAEAVAALSSDALRAFQRGEQVVISVEGSSHVLQPDELTVVHRAAGDLVVTEEGGYFAAIDPALTPELRAEGLARELVSRIQRLRKDAGFAVSDRIRVQVVGNAEVEDVVRSFGDYVAGEVLAVELVAGGAIGGTPDATQTIDLDGRVVDVALTRV